MAGRSAPATDKATDKAAADRAKAAADRAKAAKSRKIESVAAPERLVVAKPPARPDYPRYRVDPGKPIRTADIDPDESEGYQGKADVTEQLALHRNRIGDLQTRLYAEHDRALLIVLQAMDTGGKDGTIKGVFRGVNPQGCQVYSFKVPSADELAHDFLWRYHNRAPQAGMITIFNRSHYEDVLIVRVKNLVPEEEWRQRYASINEFERMLTINDITVIKFFLHISRDEQKRRLESRLANPGKRWKFSSGDLGERVLWDDYMAAFEEAINTCSTDQAPWYVVPANKKWYRNLVIARTIADTMEAMNPQYPPAEKGLEKITVPD